MDRFTFTVCLEIEAESQEDAARFAEGLVPHNLLASPSCAVSRFLAYAPNHCLCDSQVAASARGGRPGAAADDPRWRAVTPERAVSEAAARIEDDVRETPRRPGRPRKDGKPC